MASTEVRQTSHIHACSVSIYNNILKIRTSCDTISTITHDGTWLVMVHTYIHGCDLYPCQCHPLRSLEGIQDCSGVTALLETLEGKMSRFVFIPLAELRKGVFKSQRTDSIAAVLNRQQPVDRDESNTFGTVRTSNCEMLITEGNRWLACNSHPDSWRKMLSKPTETMGTSSAANTHLYLHYINIPKKHQKVASLKQYLLPSSLKPLHFKKMGWSSATEWSLKRLIHCIWDV